MKKMEHRINRRLFRLLTANRNVCRNATSVGQSEKQNIWYVRDGACLSRYLVAQIKIAKQLSRTDMPLVRSKVKKRFKSS